jgi:hypothetical protein
VKPENKIWISCQDATYLEERRREGKITFSSRFALWLHLLYCRFCKRFVRQSDLIKKYTRQMANAETPYTLSSSRKQALRKILEQ